MSSADIRIKIQSGLAKAVSKTGSGVKVYKVTFTNTGGDTPLNVPVTAEVLTELPNAIFKSYKTREIEGNIRAGDKMMVSDYTIEITEGDTIRQNSDDYMVVSTDTKAPTSDVLTYISQIRLM